MNEQLNKNQSQVEDLAKDFSKRLIEYNSVATMRKVVELNKLEKNKSICHSHDYCDTNQFIIDTLETIGITFPFDDEGGYNPESNRSTEYFELVDMANKNEFYLPFLKNF